MMKSPVLPSTLPVSLGNWLAGKNAGSGCLTTERLRVPVTKRPRCSDRPRPPERPRCSCCSSPLDEGGVAGPGGRAGSCCPS